MGSIAKNVGPSHLKRQTTALIDSSYTVDEKSSHIQQADNGDAFCMISTYCGNSTIISVCFPNFMTNLQSVAHEVPFLMRF